MISAAGVGGFNSPISLSCSSVSGLTCAFNPSTITPGSSAPATLTISAASTPPMGGYHAAVFGGLLPALGLFGTVFATRKRKPLTRKRSLSMSVFGIAACHLNVLIVGRRMRWHFKCPNAHIRISGHHDGDGNIRRNNSVRPSDHHHQLKQNGTGKGALRCAFAQCPDSEFAQRVYPSRGCTKPVSACVCHYKKSATSAHVLIHVLFNAGN